MPRALAVNELAAKGNALGLKGDEFENVNSALQAANETANKNDLILVIGSVFLVAEVDRTIYLPTLLLP